MTGPKKYHCPYCDEKQLEICMSVELSPDQRWDEEALQVIACNSCQSAGLAVYQEHRRGRSDDETVQHAGAFIPMAEMMSIRATLLLCPDPQNAVCGCGAHKDLRAVADAVQLRKLFTLTQ